MVVILHGDRDERVDGKGVGAGKQMMKNAILKGPYHIIYGSLSAGLSEIMGTTIKISSQGCGCQS